MRLRAPAECGRADDSGTGGELLVANHVSWLDIAVMAVVRPARMVAKSEVGRWPVLGRFVARGGTLFVSRERPRALHGDVAAIARALRSGSAVAGFPEGSTWCGERHGPFRRAMFQAALDAGVPVRPVAIRYLRPDGRLAHAAAFVGDDTLAASLWRLAGARGVSVEVHVLPAITPQDGTLAADARPAHRDPRARRELAAAARQTISEALQQTSGTAQDTDPPQATPRPPARQPRLSHDAAHAPPITRPAVEPGPGRRRSTKSAPPEARIPETVAAVAE